MQKKTKRAVHTYTTQSMKRFVQQKLAAAERQAGKQRQAIEALQAQLTCVYECVFGLLYICVCAQDTMSVNGRSEVASLPTTYSYIKSTPPPIHSPPTHRAVVRERDQLLRALSMTGYLQQQQPMPHTCPSVPHTHRRPLSSASSSPSSPSLSPPLHGEGGSLHCAAPPPSPMVEEGQDYGSGMGSSGSPDQKLDASVGSGKWQAMRGGGLKGAHLVC
jgi:hypothetical protein